MTRPRLEDDEERDLEEQYQQEEEEPQVGDDWNDDGNFQNFELMTITTLKKIDFNFENIHNLYISQLYFVIY